MGCSVHRASPMRACENMTLRVLCSLAIAGRAASDGSHQTVTFFIKQAGAEEIIREALAVSNPASDRYGDFLSFETIQALQRPKAEHLAKVHAHLDVVGAVGRRVSLAGDKITAVLPAAVGLSALRPLSDLEDVIDG